MKSIIRFSLNNKVALWILTLLVLAAGIYAGLRMKMETLPDITVPIVSITTVFPGAAPEEVMEKITKPIEQRTRHAQGVSVVRSTSYENASSVVIEYDYGTDMDKAAAQIKEDLNGLSLPEGVATPQVSRISLNAFPVLSLSFSNEKADIKELTRTVENGVLPTLEAIDGVASVQVSGQNANEIQLAFKPEQLAKYGLTKETVKGLIQGSALTVPLGVFEFGQSEKTLVVDGNIATLEDLKNMDIPYNPANRNEAGNTAPPATDRQTMQLMQPVTSFTGGLNAASGQALSPAAGLADSDQDLAKAIASMSTLPSIKLSEIANISIIGKVESISRTNGKESIGVSIVKAADANTVEVVDAVNAELVKLKQAQPALIVETTLDQGKPIKKSVETMVSKAIIGAIFAVFIILIFLRNIRSTIIAVISIPLSLLIAVLLLSQMDITLNVMTLGAMTVAIGRVIDDSIVVIENIYRRLSLPGEKLSGKELFLDATREMFIPIFASTIVTIAVFLPLGLVSGMIGEIFLPFALTVVFALLASLLVAVTVVPMLAHLMFRGGLPSGKRHADKPGRLAEWYKSILRWSLNHKAASFGAAVILLVGSLFLVPVIGVSFLSSDQEKMMLVTYNPAPGETKEQVQELALQAEKRLLGRPGLNIVQYAVGGANPFSPGASKQAVFNLRYEDTLPAFDDEKQQVAALLGKVGGRGEWKQQDFSGGALGGSGLSITAFGPDMALLEPVVKQLEEKLKKNAHLTNVATSLAATYEQYRLVADQRKLSQYGLTAGQVAAALSPVRSQPVLGTVKQEGAELNIYEKLEQAAYASKAELEKVVLTSPLGAQVALSDVVTIKEGQSPNTITRQDERVYAEVTADVVSSNVGAVSAELQQMLDDMPAAAGISYKLGGVSEQINESFTQLGIAMLAAIAIVYFVLVLTFGGALTPLALLLSLPFTVIGALLGLLLGRETISVTSLIGALMLIGIVVTNAIVLVDRVIHKEAEGLSVREALLEAAGTRLRPILMTAIATVGALLPLAFGFESGGLITKGMALTVIGGLTSSTLLTLVIVPVFYEIFHRRPKSF